MIKFTKEELYWIERSADIESARCMDKFLNIVKQTDVDKLKTNEQKTLLKISSELIELYTFLKELRVKLELRRK